MIATASSEIDRRVRLWRQHGMDRSSRTHQSGGSATETYPVIGYNFRMTDIQAAVGLVQLTRLEQIIASLRRLAACYVDRLGKESGLVLPREPDWARSNWQSFCIRLPSRADRDHATACLQREGIAARSGIMNAHREPCYADADSRFPLPRSEAAQDHCLILPLHSKMTEVDVDTVCSALTRDGRSQG